MELIYSERKRYVRKISMKSEEKRISGEAYDINKETIYIVLK